MVSPPVTETAQRLGLTFFEFYILGRAGVLGPAEAAVVCAELGILNPEAVETAWTSAAATVAPMEAALAYAECARTWGRARLGGLAVVAEVLPLAETLVDAVAVDGLPIVRGWRDLKRPPDPEGRLAQLLQTLREFRGRVHLLALADVGLGPVEAIVTGPDGPERAGLLGWAEPFPDPEPLRAARARVEERTDELAAQPFTVLSASERERFAAGMQEILTAIRSRTD
jgi:hypothetical protein